MTTQTDNQTTTVEAAEAAEPKKMSKKEIAQARIAANVQAIQGMLEPDFDSLTVSGGKDALRHVAESHGSNLDEIKKVHDIENEFALCSTIAMHNIGKLAAKANKEMKSLSHTFPMVGRDHFDVSVNRDGTTDLRMVRHSTNTNAGALKEAVADFGAAMAIFEAQESSADEVSKEKA